MRATVVANGESYDYKCLKKLINHGDIIICADGAIGHCINMNIIPDYWIGDFDSCSFEHYMAEYPSLKDVKIIRMNPEKDVTDTHAACDLAISLGCDEISILIGLGTRFDHSLSNVYLLEYLKQKGVKSSLRNEKNTIRLCNDIINIKRDKKYLSLIPLDYDVKVVRTNGLKYPLENYNLHRFVSLGVSNEILFDEATINVEGGAILVIESND